MIEAHLAAARSLGDLHLDRRDLFGDLIADEPIRTATWRQYLETRAEQNLTVAPPEYRRVNSAALADALPEAELAEFVHLDAFGGNMLTDAGKITAVIDFGATSVVGDRRLDPVAAVAYLASPEISPPVTPSDIEVALSWLRSANLADPLEPMRRWLGAFWLSAIDDPNVLAFCRSVLLVRE